MGYRPSAICRSCRVVSPARTVTAAHTRNAASMTGPDRKRAQDMGCPYQTPERPGRFGLLAETTTRPVGSGSSRAGSPAAHQPVQREPRKRDLLVRRLLPALEEQADVPAGEH